MKIIAFLFVLLFTVPAVAQTGTASGMSVTPTGASVGSTLANLFSGTIPPPVGVAATDTAAVQNMLNAVPSTGGTVTLNGGLYVTNATTRIKSGTHLVCSPGSGFQPVAAASFTGLYAVSNQNNSATSLTDHDITIENCEVDSTNWSANPGHTAFFMQFVNRVHIIRPMCLSGPGDCTAMVGSSDTWVENGNASGMLNACWDHWWGVTNAHVTGGVCGSAAYGALATGTSTTENTASVTSGVFINGGTYTITQNTPGAAGIWVQACGSGGSCTGAQVNQVRIVGVKINAVGTGISDGIIVTGAGSDTQIISPVFTGEYQDSVIKTGSDSSGGPESNTVVVGAIFDAITMDVGNPVVKFTGSGDAIYDSLFTGGSGYTYNISLSGSNEVAANNDIQTRGSTNPYLFTGSANNRIYDQSQAQSWQPVVNLGGTATGITYSDQGGTYWFDGKWIDVCFHITLSSKGSATGSMTIVGIPFTSDTNQNQVIFPVTWTQNLNSVTLPAPFFILNSSASTLGVKQSVDASGTALDDTSLNATSGMRACGRYLIK